MLVGEDPRFHLGKRGERPLSLRMDPATGRALRGLVPGADYSKGVLTFSWEALAALQAVYQVDYSSIPQVEPVIPLPGMAEYQTYFAQKLRSYQKEMLQFLAVRSYAVNADPMRCLAGSTKLTINRAGKASVMTLAQLSKRLPTWRRDIPTRTQSMDAQGSIVLNGITLLHRSGQKNCIKVQFSNGSVLTATEDHKVQTPGGMVRLGDLNTGSRVLVAEWPTKKADWKRPNNKSRYLQGFWDHPYAEKGTSKRKGRPLERYARVKKHRLAAEASASGLPFNVYVRRVREGAFDGLVFLDPKVWHVHHKDEDQTNDDPVNLEVMTQEQHSRLHGEKDAWRHVNGKVVIATVTAMEFAGMQETFDLTMANPLNNYVAEGVVVSNSGKTPTTLAAASLIGSKKTLIIAPSIAKLVWATELVKWMNHSSLLLYGRAGDAAREFCVPCNGTGRDSSGAHCLHCKARNGQSYGAIIHQTQEAVTEALGRHRFVIANYDILIPQMELSAAGVRSARGELPGWHAALKLQPFDLIIADEAHILRGRSKKDRQGESRRDKLVQIAQNVERFWALSGTPIYGRVADLWALLDTVTNGLFGRPFFTFDVQYAAGHKGEYGWENNGITNVEQLKSRLDAFLLKRDRATILPHLPPKTRQIIRIDAGKANFAKPKTRGGGGLHGALRVTANIKEPTVVEAVSDECAEGAKVVVYTYSRDNAQALASAISKAAEKDPRLKLRNMRIWCVTGETSVEARFKQAQAYREWLGAAAFVATIESVPVAISLKGAQSVHFADLTFDPASLLQAEDRPYEVGTNGLAIIYYVVEKTVDEHVIELVLPKMEMLESIMKEQAASDFRAAFGGKLDPEAMAEEIWTRMEAAAS